MLTGETDLTKILSSLEPTLNPGTYVYCVVASLDGVNVNDILMMFKEKEGYTLIVEKEVADRFNLDYTYMASWITLKVHSSLQAVGLTAAFSKALTDAGLSCNVVAGYYHDHIFVDKKYTDQALKALRAISQGVE